MTSTPSVQRYLHTERDSEDHAPFVPLSTMVNFFLEDIVQPNYMAQFEHEYGYNFTNTTQLEESFANDISHWEHYTLGFILFLALGVIVALVLLVLGPIIVFCLIADVGPFRRRSNLNLSTTSRRSWITYGIVVIVITFFMLLIIISMFVMSTTIRDHGENTFFTKCIDAIKALSDFLAKTADELETKFIVHIEGAKKKAFGLLDLTSIRVPMALDIASENQTSKNVRRLHTLGTQDLPKLKDDLEEVVLMINASKQEGRLLSSQGQRPEMADKLATLLGVVKMATTNDSDAADTKSLAQQMSEANSQLEAVQENIATSVGDPTAGVKNAITSTEARIKEFVETAKSISFQNIIDKIHEIHEIAVPPINGLFAFLIIILLMLLLITALHLTAFILYSPYWMPSDTPPTKNGTTQTGKIMFRAVVYMILLTAWLYWLTAAVAMYFAGMAHTEVCRHLTHPNDLRSKRVILILDAFIRSKLFNSPRKSFNILETYAQCESDKPIYKAGNVQSVWQFDDAFDLSELQRATDKLKDITVPFPQANLLTTEMKAVMLRLEDLHNQINIAGMSQRLKSTALHAASAQITNTNSSLLPEQNMTDIHEHNEKLVGKLDQIASDMATYEFRNLSRDLEANQETFRTTGEEIRRGITGNISTDVYNIFAGAVNQVKYDIENNIGRCRSMYVALKSALAEPCIQILYPINAFWFSLGLINLFLITIFTISYKLSDFNESPETADEPPMSNITPVKPQPETTAKENPSSDQTRPASSPRKRNRVIP